MHTSSRGEVVDRQVSLLEEVHLPGGVGDHVSSEEHPDSFVVAFERDAAILAGLLGLGCVRQSCGHQLLQSSWVGKVIVLINQKGGGQRDVVK